MNCSPTAGQFCCNCVALQVGCIQILNCVALRVGRSLQPGCIQIQKLWLLSSRLHSMHTLQCIVCIHSSGCSFAPRCSEADQSSVVSMPLSLMQGRGAS